MPDLNHISDTLRIEMTIYSIYNSIYIIYIL